MPRAIVHGSRGGAAAAPNHRRDLHGARAELRGGTRLDTQDSNVFRGILVRVRWHAHDGDICPDHRGERAATPSSFIGDHVDDAGSLASISVGTEKLRGAGKGVGDEGAVAGASSSVSAPSARPRTVPRSSPRGPPRGRLGWSCRRRAATRLAWRPRSRARAPGILKDGASVHAQFMLAETSASTTASWGWPSTAMVSS